MTGIPTDLPVAITEEVVSPEQVIVLVDDNGAAHLLLYAGQLESGQFVSLKHVVLEGSHREIIAGLEAEPESESELEEPEAEHEQLAFEDEPPCDCGARLMPSGWCTSGHAPKHERLESFIAHPGS